MTTTYKAIKRADNTVVYRVRFRLSKRGNPVMESFDTPEEAQRFCDLVDIAGGLAARKAREAAKHGLGGTLNSAFDAYIAHIEGHASPYTIGKYKRDWKRHISPKFGSWPVEAITRENIEAWVADLRKTETEPSKRAREKAREAGQSLPHPDYLSPKSIKNIHGLLSSVLGNEVIAERITHNRARKVALPQRQKKREPVFLLQQQYLSLLTKIPVEWQSLVNLIAGTGMRWSEATALKPEDFDLDGPQAVVRITRAWKAPGEGQGWRIGPPKTTHSIRSISLSPGVVNEILPILQDTEPGELIFPGPRGGRLRGQWFHERVWSPAVQASGLVRKPVIHDLRHSHASWLINLGVSLPIIQRRLGHASINVTVGVYGHLAPDAWKVAAEATEVAMTQVLPAFEPQQLTA